MEQVRLEMVAAVCYAAALAFYPALSMETRRRRIVLFALALPILGAPFLLPATHRFGRFIASIIAVTFTLKLYDLHVGAHKRAPPSIKKLYVFIFKTFYII